MSSTQDSSPYVPLDSWIYPAMDRLAALGFLDSAYFGLRPWTRLACAHMLAASEEEVHDFGSPLALALLQSLESEFAADVAALHHRGAHARLESAYARAMGISNTPLNDSYHFGQTIVDDFGRPFEGGFNALAGFSAYAGYGHFSLYARGEYQHAPSAPAYSLPVRQAIAAADLVPLQPPTPVTEVNRFRLLDTYVSGHALGHEVSVGKRNFQWGPDQTGSLMFSDNAPPFYGFQITRVEPLHIPLLSAILGPVRYEFIFGELQGHHFYPRPWIHGEKLSFHPTANLELGFSRVAIFAGSGFQPLTWGTFWHSFSNVNDSNPNSSNSGVNDPGDRKAGFDFRYRLPFLRDWVTLYTDSYVDDDPSPLAAPRRAAVAPGIYLARIPKLNRFDLRVEGLMTDVASRSSQGGRFIYWNVIYRDSHTNDGSIMGSWIGREGKGGQAWLNYWINPQQRITLSYRMANVANDFVPGGVTQRDLSIQGVIRIKPQLELNAFGQWERWRAPLLASGVQHDFTASVQLTYYPKSVLNFGMK